MSVTKLKVFRTPIGFHDAYVAAPSQKAALAAWGADADLFARGAAERVTDPKLMAEPLEKPGEVIRRARGTAAEHLAALPRDRVQRTSARAEAVEKAVPKPGRSDTPSKPSAKPPGKPKPRPSSAKRDALEGEMDALEARQRQEMDEIAAEQAQLQRHKIAIELGHEGELAALQRKLDRAKSSHERALQRWRAQR